MSHALFFLTNENPNDTTGGGGCLCSPFKQADTRGPYIVIPSNDMEDIVSPHVVVCAECLERLNAVAAGESLGTGNGGKVTHLPTNAPRGDDHRLYVSPVVDIDEEHKPVPRRPRKPREE